MRSDRVVVLSPLLDDNLHFLQAVQDFAVQQFIAEFSVKRATVRPGAAMKNGRFRRIGGGRGLDVRTGYGCVDRSPTSRSIQLD